MFSRLSFIAFFISGLSIGMLYTGINPLNFSYNTLMFLFIILGMLGFLMSMLSIFFDKKNQRSNKAASFIFYIGIILVYAGLIFKFMHWPFFRPIMISGAVIALGSFFIRFRDTPKDDGLLDS
jgi:predicted membrane channel-forming protein YqfA (hemolysin III family)